MPLIRPLLWRRLPSKIFLGYGQILSLKASLGSTTNNIDLSFTEPWLFDLPLWCKADIWKYKKDYDDYSLDSRGAGLTLGYPIWERIVGYIGYKLSADEISNVSGAAPIQILDQEGQTNNQCRNILFKSRHN